MWLAATAFDSTAQPKIAVTQKDIACIQIFIEQMMQGRKKSEGFFSP